MARLDIDEAIEATPQHIRWEIAGSAKDALAFLDTHLPADEMVAAITSASPRPKTDANSLLVLTRGRLIFVAPAPQVVSWRLSTVTRAQLSMGYFFIEGDAGEYSPGLLDDDWGQSFEVTVKRAAAVAALAMS